LLPGNELQYALDRTLGGPQSNLEHRKKGKVSILTGNKIQVVDTVGNHSSGLLPFINSFRLLAEKANAKKKRKRNYVSIFIFRVKNVVTS
jgi:hypothetical protein